ncbi:alpha/beta hydrolase [Oceanirhabdus sp. W0125-5]|uniref:alpha/beta hydrolase n=1 Tax=Oceanirhabdus sp. W0125-5 TaxID=2999116 RepID=UPI0022F3325F|nr:dienelactone hydrolase family protein [Oceanirhabdus sp. W0125-5]WBW98343.1 dienelactone hydrolase family protein [Oceanirhabdus sp. W0125-5]
MKYNSFDELEVAYCKFSDKEKYNEAIEVLEEGLKALPKEECEKNFYHIMIEKCWLYCNDERFNEAVEIFSDLIDKGYICPIDWNFDGLKGHEKYKELEEKNELIKKEAQKNAKFDYVVRLPENYNEGEKYPVFFSLHGDGENIQVHEKYWSSEWLTKRGFIVVCPQASIVYGHEGYIWIDKGFYAESYETRKYPYTYSELHKEFKNCYDLICEQYSVDEENIIIGGFSGGAVAAIDITISNVIPVKGVIPLCSLKPRSFREECVKSVIQRGVKFVFMDGEEDVPMEQVDEMIEALDEHGIPHEYYINEGIGHWYPADLEGKLNKALNFIME